MNDQELLYLLALKKAKNVGDIFAKKLLQIFGSAQEVFKQSGKSLEQVDGIGDIKIEGLKESDLLSRAEIELEFINKNNIACRVYTEPEYSLRLNQCIDSPILYFEKGNFDINQAYSLSIVGTRKMTTYGEAVLEEFMEFIAPLNPIIVSGYAYGVDILAHKKAMELGLTTVAVMAHGIDQTYPKVHAAYNEKMMGNGGFITDFWHKDPFDRKNFLGRNRIIAGLTEATVVIESASKGGSLVTANMANDYNREVFAVPGRITDQFSEGCNNLIKQNKAVSLTIPADVPYILGWDIVQRPAVQKQLFVELSTNEQLIYDVLKSKEHELLDLIALQIKLPVHKVASLLLSMELNGIIKPLPGKRFTLA